MLRIGIDTGGTFTDFVVVDDSGITTWKEPSTPDDPSRAILAGLDRILKAAPRGGGPDVIHGSTVATNALLEGKTARAAFITNRGFEDMLEIGRQARPDLYDIDVERPESLVPRERRFGLAGRLGADGAELEPLVMEDLTRLAKDLAAARVASVAICLLHSYADPRHEETVARALTGVGLAVSVSSRLVREYREYERASTAAVNAAVGPVVSRYLGNLSAGLSERGIGALRVMGSNGGALSSRTAGEEAVRTVLSGPAAGVRGAVYAGRLIGCPAMISFDMGGTSTDVSLIPGEARLTADGMVAGHPVRIPMIDIHTVGAGGGSIAWRDPGGALRVGPASAGAEPGPACYGRGGPPTVTDANLLLGRIVPERFLDGRMPLDLEAARRAVGALARELGMETVFAAEGIVTVAEATMARAIRVISLYRGFEPADFALVAFGGAGGLHAASLAASLEMGRAIVPAEPGVFSAFGMTVADVERDRSASVLESAARMNPAALAAAFAPLEAAARDDLRADGVTPDRIGFIRSVDARYAGQSYELNLPVDPADGSYGSWHERFHDEHERRFGYRREGEPVELVTLRLRGVGRVDPPAPRRVGTRRSRAASGPPHRDAIWHGAPLRTAVRERGTLGAGETVEGPALILEAGATCFVPPDWSAAHDEYGNLHLARRP